MNANNHICYDPYLKKFYTFSWSWCQQATIFPSMVIVSYDIDNYENQVSKITEREGEGKVGKSNSGSSNSNKQQFNGD